MVTVTSYLYDADGHRLIRRDPAGATLYLSGGQELRYDHTTQALTMRALSSHTQTLDYDARATWSRSPTAPRVPASYWSVPDLVDTRLSGL